MAISGVGQNFYRNNVETKGNTKNVNNTEKFALEKQAVHGNYRKRKKWSCSRRNFMKTFLKSPIIGR